MDRRDEIVRHMQDAADLVFECAELGLFAREPTEVRKPALLSRYEEYRSHAREALRLFVTGEEEAAMWTQVEFYAGFVEPATLALEGTLLVSAGGHANFTLPRWQVLREWSLGGPQPVYGTFEDSAGDSSRHKFVPPNASGPPGMDWAPLLLEP